jgi:outer membrane protein assembly factor BamB
LFLLVVGLGMVVAHARHKSSDPWRSPVLLEFKAQLLADPGSEVLKEKIRVLDLQLRERYFRLLSLKGTGVHLLLGGALVFVYAGNRVRQLTQGPPLPQPDTEGAARLNRQAGYSRNAIAVCGALALATFAFLGFTPARSPLSDAELQSRLLADPEPLPAEVYAVSPGALQANWPRFRGYEGAGVAAAGPSLDSPPSILGNTPSPAVGFNSPLVWDNRVLFTGGDSQVRTVVCLSAVNGELQWRRELSRPAAGMAGDAPEIPDMTGYAAPTAATDGERVYAVFASGELAAFTLGGEPLWMKQLGLLDNPYGHASSLVTWEDQVIVQLDQGYDDSRKSRIIAFDGRTGEMRWQKARPVGASWATPTVIAPGGTPQVVALGLPWTIAYSPDEGRELWRAQLLEGEITSSPVFGRGHLFIVDPGMYQLIALNPLGNGDITETHQVWRVDGDMPDITSPVTDGELVFTLTSDGRFTCFDATTGEQVWQQPIDAEGEFQASPSLVGSTLLLLSTAGDAVAVLASREFRELWRIRLEDEFYASPAFANQTAYLRGNRNIWCLGNPAGMTISK